MKFDTNKLAFLQTFFFRTFWLSFILLFISTFMCMVLNDFQLAFVQKYFTMDAKDYNYLVVLILGVWKVFIVQFTLIPAVAIWTIKKCCEHC